MMPERLRPRGCGLRERKKERTRQALTTAAAELFDRKGFDETTVAEIAAAADVSTRTFFSYFTSKEDVLFAEVESFWAAAAETISTRQPSDRPADALLRAVRVLCGHDFETDSRLARVRWRLMLDNPTVQGSALRRLFAIEQEIARSLHAAFPDELDEQTAGAIVGALVGGLVGAALSTTDPTGCRMAGTEVRRIAEQVVRGVTAPPGPPGPPPGTPTTSPGDRARVPGA